MAFFSSNAALKSRWTESARYWSFARHLCAAAMVVASLLCLFSMIFGAN